MDTIELIAGAEYTNARTGSRKRIDVLVTQYGMVEFTWTAKLGRGAGVVGQHGNCSIAAFKRWIAGLARGGVKQDKVVSD